MNQRIAELNAREERAQELRARYLLLAVIGLGIFCILVAIIRSHGA